MIGLNLIDVQTMAPTVVDNQMVQLMVGPLVDWLLSTAAAIVVVAVPLALTWGRQHLTIMQNAIMANLISGAATRGAGMAVSYLQTAAADRRDTTVDVRKTAVSIGVGHVLASFPDAVRIMKVSPDQIANMVAGEIGKQTAGVIPLASFAAPQQIVTVPPSTPLSVTGLAGEPIPTSPVDAPVAPDDPCGQGPP